MGLFVLFLLLNALVPILPRRYLVGRRDFRLKLMCWFNAIFFKSNFLLKLIPVV